MGGWDAPNAALAFTRSYENGAGASIGASTTLGSVAYAYARAGGLSQVTPDDAIALSVEFGREWLSTGTASETQSGANPFPAQYGRAQDTMNLGKLRAQWTHSFSTKFDATATIAVAKPLDHRTNLGASIPGAGILAPGFTDVATWGEYGLRVGWRITKSLTADVFTNMVLAGGPVGTGVHSGAGLRFRF